MINKDSLRERKRMTEVVSLNDLSRKRVHSTEKKVPWIMRVKIDVMAL